MGKRHQAVEAAGLTNHVHYLSHGETYTFMMVGEGSSQRTP
jgi:hypothetical protein